MTPEEEGQALERIFFGRSSDFRPGAIPQYEELEQAVIYVKEHQQYFDWNPFYPLTEESMHLFKAVQSELPRRIRDKLLLYSAVGTALDVHHGIDGFFAIDGYDFIISIDLARSTTEWKKRSQKADFIVTWEDVNEWERLAYLSSRISKKIRTKIDETIT